MNYDFSQLNDKEFEILATDLLSHYFEKRIERFKSGRDGGVDGRFFSNENKETVLQCKHYLKTGYRGLISKLSNEEKQKVNKLNPNKYIFITSLPLSRDNKKEIRAIFYPYIKRDDDVFGQEDLNCLLARYPKVEEKHFKLWISSTTVFHRIINNAIKGRSEHELEQIQQRSYKHVETDTYIQALSILKKHRVLIVSGEPGIGKTTLAENICLYYASKDYEFIDIEESLSEAEGIYTRGKKQIFYFDDFLGSNYFEAIENKKDSHIAKFIERIKSDNQKIFVLTSRTNILNSGVLHSNIFSNQNIQKDEFLLTIKSLALIDRAKILYNHIWFSELANEFIDKIYEGRRYIEIIKHQNFNPRLVEFITDLNRIGETNSDNYWRYIEETLRNPKDIWGNCFKIQNSEFVRSLVNLVVFNGGHISEDELRAGYERLANLGALRNTSNTEKDFNSTSQLATKSFLKRYLVAGDVFYSLFNPSISDYVLSEYCRDIEKLTTIYKSLGTVQSLKELVSLDQEGVISHKNMTRLIGSIFEEALNGSRNYDYLIFSSHLVFKDGKRRGDVLRLMRSVIGEPAPIQEFSKFLSLLTDLCDDLQLSSYEFLSSTISNRYLDEFEISDLVGFITCFDIDDDDLTCELKNSLEMLIRDELESQKTGLDLSDLVTFSYWEDGEDGEEDVNFERGDIEYELSNVAESVLENFNLDVFGGLDIEIENIVSEVDIDEMVNDYIGSLAEPDHDDYYRGGAVNTEQGIDDLFERS